MKTKKYSSILQKIENGGLMLLLLLVPVQTRWIMRSGHVGGYENNYLSLSVYATDILVLFLLALGLMAQGRQKRWGDFSLLRISAPHFWFWCLVVVSWCSVIFASNHVLAVQRSMWIMLGGGLAWLMSRNADQFRQIHWFLVGVTVSALVGIAQFVFQYAPASKWLGLASHDPAAGGSSVVEITNTFGQNIRWLRAYGMMDHPNVFGVVMGIGMFLALHVLLNEKERFTKRERLGQHVVLITSSMGVLVSLSRAAIGGVAVALVVALAALFYRKQQRMVFRTLKMLVMPLVFCGVLLLAYPQQFMVRSDAQGRLEAKSIAERKISFDESRAMIREDFLWGVGAGNYVEKLVTENPGLASWLYQPVHNVFLLLWAELGLFGILTGIGLAGATIARAYKTSIFLLAACITLVPAILLDHWLYDLHVGMLIFACVVSFVPGGIKQVYEKNV